MPRPLSILCLLSLAGLATCMLLIAASATLTPGLCSSACNTVLASPYAKPLGIPLSHLGLTYYASIFAATLLTSVPYALRRNYLKFASALGLLASIAFVATQATLIGAFCTLCLTSAVIATLIALTSFFLPPAATRPAPRLPWSLQWLSPAAAMGMSLVLTLVLFQHASHSIRDRLDPPLASVATVTFRTSDAAAALGTDLTNATDPQSRYLLLTNWLDEQLHLTRLETYARFLRKSPAELVTPIFEAAKSDPASLESRLAAFAADLEKKYPATIHLKHPPADRDFAWQDAILLRGEPTAPTRVLVFTDYACPHCRALAHILNDLIPENSADVALAYRSAWSNKDSESARASLDAFTALRASVDAGTQRQTHAALLAAGGDEAAIRAIRSKLAPRLEHHNAITAQDRQASNWGITAVPSVWINGQPLPAPYSKDQLRQTIQAAQQPAN